MLSPDRQCWQWVGYGTLVTASAVQPSSQASIGQHSHLAHTKEGSSACVCWSIVESQRQQQQQRGAVVESVIVILS